MFKLFLASLVSKSELVSTNSHVREFDPEIQLDIFFAWFMVCITERSATNTNIGTSIASSIFKEPPEISGS